MSDENLKMFDSDLNESLHGLLSSDSEVRELSRKWIVSHPQDISRAINSALKYRDARIRRGLIVSSYTAGVFPAKLESLLLAALNDDDVWLRYEACHFFEHAPAQIKSEELHSRIRHLLRDSNEYVRQAAVFAIVALGGDSVGLALEISQLLSDLSPNVRWAVASALNQLNVLSSEIIGPLLISATDEDPMVRKEVAPLLCRFSTEAQGIDCALASLLQDANYDVREATLLGISGSSEIHPTLIPYIIANLSSSVASLRIAAKTALAKIHLVPNKDSDDTANLPESH